LACDDHAKTIVKADVFGCCRTDNLADIHHNEAVRWVKNVMQVMVSVVT
jgi:hypothetical protein